MSNAFCRRIGEALGVMTLEIGVCVAGARGLPLPARSGRCSLSCLLLAKHHCSERFSVQSNVVQVPVIVTERNGRNVDGLSPRPRCAPFLGA
jgi:hypothetical protein